MLKLLLLLLLPPSSVLTHPPPPSPSTQLLFQSPTFQTFENLAVRPNGHLVLTVSNEPFVYDLDPQAPHPSPKPLHQFPNVIGTFGIAETAPDVFAVVAGNWSRTLEPVPGSFSIWSVDLNAPEPAVELVASIPEAKGLNGMTTLGGASDVVLVADSALGAVWRVDVVTGEYGIAFQSPLFTNDPGIGHIGINGVRTFERMLYFTNSARGTYGRVSVTDDGSAAGEVQILGQVDVPAVLYDDFDIDREGNAWITTHPDSLLEVTAAGIQRNVTGEDDIADLIQPTSARFGRGSGQEGRTLYVVTAGSDTVGGQVIAVNNIF